MVLPLVIGGAMMAGGTAASLIGQGQREKATDRALKNYSSAIEQRTAQERAALGQESGYLHGLATQRQGGIGSYLYDLDAAQRPTSDEGFRSRQGGALTDIKELTQGADGSYAYQGAPRGASVQRQGVLTGASNSKAAEALLADYTLRQITQKQQAAGHRMALGDLLRNSQGKSTMERFQLAKALRDLDWQRKTAAMQNQLNDAGKKGQMMQTLGGLGTQAGGMLAMYGLSGGGGTAPTGMEGAPAGATDLSSFQGSFTDPQLPGMYA